MSKNYLCKECVNNNNGWCVERKMQGLKNITTCDFSHNNGDSIAEFLIGTNESSRVFGMREMMWMICQQILGMERNGKTTITIDELKDLMVSMGVVVDSKEMIYGIEINGEVDKTIIDTNKQLIHNWKFGKGVN